MSEVAATSGARRRPKRPARRGGRISLTPLVDVVFILVIFFMLASTFTRTNSVELVTPKSGGGQATSSDAAMTVTLLGDGRYDLQGREVGAEVLAAELAERGDKRVVVRTGDGAALQDVVSFLDLSAKLGLTDIAFAADPNRADPLKSGSER